MNRILIIGLGNPGTQYENTRHNAGWLVVDELIHLWEESVVPKQWSYEKKLFGHVYRLKHRQFDIIFLKPDTFMNESGKAAAAAAKWFLHVSLDEPQEVKNILVLHDDLDLELGKYKLQFGSGPKVHNGVNSIRRSLNTAGFWSGRLGIDTRAGDRSIPGQAYVLQKLSTAERQRLAQTGQTLAEELEYVVLQ